MALWAGLALAGTVEEVGMTASWAWDDDALVLVIQAPTTGWVAVGLNDRQGLENSRLVMAAVRDGEAVAEEHVARPPNHPHVADLEVLGALEAEGWTRVWVSLPTGSARPNSPVLQPGDKAWFTVAWSQSDDFEHHSAQRTAVWATL